MHKIFLLLVFFPLLNGWFSSNQQLDLVRITSPKEGDILQGSIYIQGTISGASFQFAEVSFQYQEAQSSNWFLIETIDATIVDDTIAIWDTSTIADGVYRIKVVAYYNNNQSQEAILNNLDIRNYTPIEPESIVEGEEESTPEISAQVENLITPTTEIVPTAMSPNEMSVSRSQFLLTLLQGAIFGILLLVVFLLLVIIRRRKLG